MRLGESGVALLVAIVLATVLGMLGAVIALTAQMELLVSGKFQQGQELSYAAEGALARALADLASADWTAALAGAPSTFAEGDPRGADALTEAVARAASGGRTWGPDTPRWTLYAWGPASAWLPGGVLRSSIEVAVWLADDPADGDGNPTADANRTVDIMAVAWEPGGGRRALRAMVVRPSGEDGEPLETGVRMVSLHTTRW